MEWLPADRLNQLLLELFVLENADGYPAKFHHYMGQLQSDEASLKKFLDHELLQLASKPENK